MKKKLLAVALAATMVVSSAISAFAVNTTDAISGDLTVTTFFNEKTDAVELKSGDSITFKFNNKTNGTNNYENYVMAVVGAEGDAYTGATEEVLVIRADAWGWGGGLSDFDNPAGEGNTGNPLVFESDVDWDSWVAAMQAGADCDVTIARDGDTLTYTAKIGDYNVSTTAKSGKALPDSCYVFFTGENCTLTGFATTKNSASVSAVEKEAGAQEEEETTVATPNNTTTSVPVTAPATGDTATTAAVLVVMIAAAGAVVVLKRKKASE